MHYGERRWRRYILGGSAMAAAWLGGPLTGDAAPVSERPNIVIVVSEDNSVHFMEHFHPGGARLPHIEGLAANGVTFDRAFSNAPVCSVARTTLITAMHAPRIATAYHRRFQNVTLPSGWEMYPYYLRQDGYHTVKRGKKDFNAHEGDIWDQDGNEAHWSSRPDDQTPFFYVVQTGPETHEGNLHFDEETFRAEPTTHDPDAIEVFPYLPDTELMRYTHARFLDRHLLVDANVGEVLAELDEHGLRDNTIVMYYGDHGGVLPRSKGHLYEGGLHVPLVVYIPEKFQHLSPFEPGSRVGGFVEFVDIGPTVLNLAGVGLPGHLDGKPFLGPDITARQVEDRDETFSYADRFDEKYDKVRALRKGNFKYIRHFLPHYPDALTYVYRDRQLAFGEWKELYEAGELNDVQSQFYQPRQAEALYDLAADPHETVNLAGDPEYAEILLDLRGRLRQRMRSLPDLGLFFESYLLEHAVQDPRAFAQTNTTRITRLLGVADLMLIGFAEARARLESALHSDDPWMRYWGLTVCAVFGAEAAEFQERAQELTTDDLPAVRVRAAEFLGVLGTADPLPILYDVVRKATNTPDALLALNTIVYLRDFRGYQIDPDQIEPRRQIRRIQLNNRLDYLRTAPGPSSEN